jgi:hypothetical protein
MALPDYEPDDVTGTTEQVLRALLNNFSLSPLRSGKHVRDLLLADYFGFRAAALVVLRESLDIRGLRYLITLLWTNDLLISILGDVTLSRELSISISQTAIKVDTQLHIRLTRFLVAGMLEGRDVEEKTANRLLEVLGAISEPHAIQGFLRQMLQHPNPRIRSKITLLVGSGGHGGRALRKLLSDPEEDPRVRANALEALWSSRDREILDLFCDMLSDPHNRVAGNAVLGLYLAGDPQSIAYVRKMAAHTETPFRQTAAWVMGKTEDPRFLPDAGRLLGQPHVNLRKTVFRSVSAIKNAVARRAKNPPLALTIIDIAHGKRGKTQIRLSIAGSHPVESPQIPATGFAIQAFGKPVEQFSCMERRNSIICAAFVFPRRQTESDPLRLPLRQALLQCLDEKPAGDRWSIVRYYECSRAGSVSGSFRMFGQTFEETRVVEKKTPINLTGAQPALRTDIESNGLRADTASSVFEAITKMVGGFKPIRSARYILVIADSEEEIDGQRFEEMAQAAWSSGISINAISTKDNMQLERLCQGSAGIFHVVNDIEGIGPAMKLLYQSFKSEYLLEFICPTAEPGVSGLVTIQAYNESAVGETTLELVHESLEETLELVDSNA